jgi:hypothetical protein
MEHGVLCIARREVGRDEREGTRGQKSEVGSQLQDFSVGAACSRDLEV